MTRSTVDGWFAWLTPKISFALGAYWFNHEVQGTGERPYLLVLCAVMMMVLPADMIDKWLTRRSGK